MALENLVWLAAGVGLGLFVAMVLLALGILRDSVAYRRRLRAGRLASAALGPAELRAPFATRPSSLVSRTSAVAVAPDPPPVETPAREPASASVEAAVEPGPPVPLPPPQPVSPAANEFVVAVAPAPQSAPLAAVQRAESKAEAEAPAAAIKAEPPTPAAEAKPVGIQAAVAAALEKRRAERAARIAAGGELVPPPPISSPPRVRPRAAVDKSAEAAVSGVDVEELFARAFETSADTSASQTKPD